MSPKKTPRHWPRIVLVGLVALLVAATGMVILPRDSGDPEPVPFSESARAAAYEDAVALRESAGRLVDAQGSNAADTALADAVTLLTTHARALLKAGDRPPVESPTRAGVTDPDTPADVVTRLSASGGQRLRDAEKADGGTSRLLAAVGTAQVLEAERIAARLKLPAPAPAGPAASPVPPGSPVPAASDSGGQDAACASAGPATDPAAATTASALAAAVRLEHESVYVYQVALKRLPEAEASEAAKSLEAHQQLLKEAELLTRANCADVPRREAGYRLGEHFTEDPAAALGTMEIGSLPAFGDLIALSDGRTRAWAAEALMAATRRALAWGAACPALPGLAVDVEDLPALPTPAPTAAGN